MIANYHTHTYRCRHAKGTEREYIENAIKAGIKILGFSDHSPYIFNNGHVSEFRMLPSQAEDYFETLTKLKEEYKDEIEIHIGVEAEYYPEFFEDTVKFLENFPCEYMILGQHVLSNEYDEKRYTSIKPTDNVEIFRQYIDQVIEGMKTGKYIYFAHPDLLLYTADADVYRSYYQEICDTAKKLDLPLEYNLLGIRAGRHYPNKTFWEIAAKTENKVILGIDAHDPECILNTETYEKAKNALNELGITPIETLCL